MSDNASVDMSKIKGKPVDATGRMAFSIDFEHFKSPFCVEKIFGLVDMKTNEVFKFKLVVSEDELKNFKLKLTYVSEDPIDCKIKIGNQPLEILENLTSSDEAKIFQFKPIAAVPRVNVSFSISILVITTASMNNFLAKMFNNLSTSDFTVHCQDKQFYVHQRILREKSEYFEALLHNDCIEKRNKLLKIDDFPHKIV